MKKVVITVGIIALAIASFFINDLLRNPDDQGEVQVIVVNQLDEIVHDDILVFDEGDTLLSLLDEHYDLACANAQYKADECDNTPFFGNIILEIGPVETDWLNTYIGIYVNGEYSSYGIDDISLQDGDVYQFEYTVVGEVDTE